MECARAEDLWDREYGTLQVIPSSTRPSPSKALILFSEILEFENLRVLDAGCGIGRNAIYLAKKGCEVHALDVSDVALAKLNSAALSAGVRERITVHKQLVEETLPFESDSFDLVLDSYVFCHFVNDHFRNNYRRELHRVARPSGLVFSSLFTTTDQYYSELIQRGYGKERIVVDPHNGITKRLYTEQETKRFFSIDFNLRYFVKLEFPDVVLGRSYWRSIFSLVLEKEFRRRDSGESAIS